MYNYIMLRTQISLTEEARALLDARAEKTGKSISALIREAVVAQYGDAQAHEFAAAIRAASGAWKDRDFDGKSYVEAIRDPSRLDEIMRR